MNFSFKTSNGITRDEEGNELDKEDPGGKVTGSYSYTAPDGKIVTVTFVSDANGFRPKTSIGG